MEFVTLPAFIFSVVLVCVTVMAFVLLFINIVQYKYIKELEKAIDAESEKADHFRNMYEKTEVKNILNDFQEH